MVNNNSAVPNQEPTGHSTAAKKSLVVECNNNSSGAIPKNPIAPRLTEEGKQVPIGNGGICSNYYWTQTLNDATVYIDIPSGKRGKDIVCSIRPKKLYVELRGEEVFIDGELEDLICQDDSVWTLLSGQIPQIVITLEKSRKTWWKHIIIGHPEIDTTKVCTVKSST